MTDEKVSARPEITAQLVDNCFLGRSVKVNEHVAAKNNAEHFTDTIIGIHKI
jgi:hypothetical protein